MKLPSTIVRLWVADILEGRGTIDEVEPGLQNLVNEALVVYTQPRAVPVIDQVEDGEKITPDVTPAADPGNVAATPADTPVEVPRAKEVADDGQLDTGTNSAAGM